MDTSDGLQRVDQARQQSRSENADVDHARKQQHNNVSERSQHVALEGKSLADESAAPKPDSRQHSRSSSHSSSGTFSSSASGGARVRAEDERSNNDGRAAASRPNLVNQRLVKQSTPGFSDVRKPHLPSGLPAFARATAAWKNRQEGPEPPKKVKPETLITTDRTKPVPGKPRFR